GVGRAQRRDPRRAQGLAAATRDGRSPTIPHRARRLARAGEGGRVRPRDDPQISRGDARRHDLVRLHLHRALRGTPGATRLAGTTRRSRIELPEVDTAPEVSAWSGIREVCPPCGDSYWS